jgi:glyoxylase-like metal-dependent hydrolase (beta-lactamase superfamily II)
MAEEEKKLEECFESHRLKPVMQLDTHCHLDHVIATVHAGQI